MNESAAAPTPVETVAIVVPCYNEADRLDPDAFVAHAEAHPDQRFVFVDDGSTDATARVLEALCARLPERLSMHRLAQNTGKAEAVRQGFLQCFAEDNPADAVGFWDADLATPLEDISPFADVLRTRADLLCVFGARVNLLGRSVKRGLLRHYVGRVFATAAAAILRLGIYDTQCGAKLFRRTPDVESLFARPFVSRWIFDVELIARLRNRLLVTNGPPAASVIYEFPLMVWRDVAGSKLRAKHFAIVALDMLRIWRDNRSPRPDDQRTSTTEAAAR